MEKCLNFQSLGSDTIKSIREQLKEQSMKNESFDDVYNCLAQLEQIDAHLLDKSYRLIALEKGEQRQEASEAALEFRENEFKVATKYKPKRVVRKR